MRIAEQVEQDGYAVVPDVIPDGIVEELRLEFGHNTHAARNLLKRGSIQQLARSPEVRSLIQPVLGQDCFAIRGTFFDKVPEANWKVPLHQDRMIPVRDRSEAEGFRLWSVKEGVTFVQPPVQVMENILAIRLHLDDVGENNGPLRVIPGSHRDGYITDADLDRWRKHSEVTCVCPKGSALLMRPLLLHASSPAKTAHHRRVIHLEFAGGPLPGNVEWHEQI